MKFYPIFILLFLITNVSQAALFKVTTKTTGFDATFAETMRGQLETELNKDVPDTDFSTYLDGMANGGSMAAKGQGSDYANDIDVFLFGINLGAGFDIGDQSLFDLDPNQAAGFGVNASLLFGMSLSVFDLPSWEWFDPNRIKVFVNILPPGMVKQEGSNKDYDLGHIGIHARYNILPGEEYAQFGMAKWGGVMIHTGLEITSLKFAVTQKFNQTSQTLQSGSETLQYDNNSTLTFGAEVSAVSIPIEASTSFQVAHILTFYGGLGVDITTSSSTSLINTNSSIANTAWVGGTLNGQSAPTYEITSDSGSEGSGDVFGARYFAGLQLTAPVWKPITLHINGGFNGVYGITAGTKFTW